MPSSATTSALAEPSPPMIVWSSDAGVVLRTEVLSSERRQMLELFEEGLSMNKVGRRVGRDPKTVRATIIAAGLTPPRRR